MCSWLCSLQNEGFPLASPIEPNLGGLNPTEILDLRWGSYCWGRVGLKRLLILTSFAPPLDSNLPLSASNWSRLPTIDLSLRL